MSDNGESKDIYKEEGVQKLRDEGQLDDWEAGFMQGASGGGKGAKCRKCGKILTDDDKTKEMEIDDEKHLFCSDECADEYMKDKKEDSKKVFKDYQH